MQTPEYKAKLAAKRLQDREAAIKKQRQQAADFTKAQLNNPNVVKNYLHAVRQDW